MWHIEYLNNGYYKIASIIEPNYVLDVADGKKESKTNVQLYKSNGTDAQQWAIVDAGGGNYKIVSKLGNFVIDVSGGLTDNGTNIQIYKSNNTEAQEFKIENTDAIPVKDGLYKITSFAYPNNMISIYDNYLNKGTNIVLAIDNNTNGQKWYIKYAGNGYYSITSAYSNSYSLDIADGSIDNGANVQLYKNNGTDAQRWYIKYSDGKYVILSKLNHKPVAINEENVNNNINYNIEINDEINNQEQQFSFEETEKSDDIPEYSNANYADGYYIISSFVSSNYVLDITSGLTQNGTNIQAYSLNSSLAQIWHIQNLGDGYYYITSAINRDTSLEAAGAGTNVGTNVQLYKKNNTDAQKWLLKDTGDGYVTIVSKISNLAIDLSSVNISNGTNAYLNELIYSKTQKFKLTPYSSTKIYKGIDVSAHNGYIDWQAAAKDIDFAIIRLGYGGGADGADDYYFERNVRECENNNIPYGVYLYSYALNSDIDTTVEIEHVSNSLQYANPNLGTKVFFDMEDADGWKKRHGIYDDNQLLNTITNKFCTGVESLGLTCGIYANVDWLTNKLNAQELAKKYTIWVAIWPDNANINNFQTAYNMRPAYNLSAYNYWQFTSNGRISGINGSVDLNMGYDIFD